MPAKRKNPADTGHGATAGPVLREEPIDENPSVKSSGLKSSIHGNVFQLKLLVLFLIRGIKAKYQFHLGTEIPGVGGKFDDLIFKYEVQDDESMTEEIQGERYRYLQAKHKQNEDTEKITASDLLNDNEGEFSLPKYFRSYCHDIIDGINRISPEKIQDCIICTNIGFEEESKLKEKGIELLPLVDKDDILNFDMVPQEKSPTRYKLKKTEALREEMKKWSDIHLLARTLLENVAENKKLTLSTPIFKSYHFALIDEEIIDKRDGKLCATFLEGDSDFREILSELTFVHYWGKLKFNCDDNKKSRVDCKKKLDHFEGKSLENLLPKYTLNKIQKMEIDFSIFQDFYDDLISEKIVDIVGQKLKAKPFTTKFIRGKILSKKGSEFRGKLRNTVFIHFWKDLSIKLSETFGRKIIGSPQDENKSIKNSVGLQKEIDDFLDKLVFAVHTPNEVELGDILKSEVSDRYSLKEGDFKSDFILRNMLDWFKKKESNFMTSKEGIDILENGKKKMKSLRMTAVSIDYQRKLKGWCEFNDESIREMTEKLRQLLISENRIGEITTPLPKRTAVKVIAALKALRQSIPNDTTRTVAAPEYIYFQRKDSYLMASFIEIKDKYEKFKKALNSDITSHHLLIVICEAGDTTEGEKYYEKLVKKTSKKVMILKSPNKGEEIKDNLKFTDFSDHFKKILLSKKVKFQGSSYAVGDLIKRRSDQTVDELIQCGEPEMILNLDSIEELIENSEIEIPSLSSSRFEKSLYIKRQLTSAFPLDDEFWQKVSMQLGDKYSPEKLYHVCRVNQIGEIEWIAPIVPDKEKEKIWEKMNYVLDERKSFAVLSPDTVTEDDSLIYPCEKEKLPRIVIISGVAGAGKSSILSHYYEKIKESNPDHWVIIINFTDHSKDFLKLNSNEVNISNTIECLVNLSAVVGESRFGCSMLRRRLELGDRITVLFDGFDEIVKSQYQETALRVIKVLRESKSAGLYVTTRSHMASQLQCQLSQLTYYLENFSKQDQINYLTSLWQRNFNDGVEENLRHFAELLIDRISTTLKDGERNFIGIPLQCRILAECFETDVQKYVHSKSELDSILESIKRLNLANLYRLLMKKKHDIYEQEKKALSLSDDLADSHAKEDIYNLEPFLRKLAIKTIVSIKEQVNILLGTQSISMKSKGEQLKKNEKRVDHCTRFGLLDTNAEGKVRFLHRTYAEFLMAEYLYTGFCLDDEKRNRLLDCEFARKLIIDHILAKEKYDGVQVFFDSMLEEIVDENKEWQSNVVQGELPERFFKLSEILFSQFLRQNRKPYSKKHPNALRFSAKNRKEKIFKFLCDCLDATFDKSEVLRAMTISFLSGSCTEDFLFSLKVFSHQSSEVFQRFVGYYSSASTNSALENTDGKEEPSDVELFVEKIFYGLPISNLEDPHWNAKEQQKIVDCLLDAMKNQTVEIDRFFQPFNECYIEPLVALLIFNENYEYQLEKFFKIISQTNTYSNDSTLANFIKNVFLSVKKKNRQGKRTLKALDILSRERKNVAMKLHAIEFSIEPETYRSDFRPSRNDIFRQRADDIDLLNIVLQRDLFNITPLHRAAFNKETDAINEVLTTVKKYLTQKTDAVLKSLSEQVVDVMCYDENGFTPFYVAAARGYGCVYGRMLMSLKEFITLDTLENILTVTNGFVYHALSDAMESENLKMFQVILNAVKTILGQSCLLNLLKSSSRENKSQNRYHELDFWSDTIFGVACRFKNLFQTLTKIVVRNGTGEDYQDWNNLIFHLIDTEGFNRYTLKHVNAEIVQGILSLDSNNWIKRFFDIDLLEGFEVLSNRLIKYFHENQLKELVEMLTLHSDERTSYWRKLTSSASWFTYLIENDAISKFMKCVSEKLDESFVYQLVIHLDEKVIIHSMELAVLLLPHLSKEKQEEAKRHWKMNSSKTINDIFFTPTSKIFWLTKMNSNMDTNYLIDIIWFYLDNGSDVQLKDFIQTITSLHDIGYKKRSMWSYVFEKDRAAIKIIQHVSEKAEIFGDAAAKTLLFHVVDEDPHYLNAVWWKKDIDEILTHLPRMVHDEIQQCIRERASGFIEEILRDLGSLISWDTQSYTILNTLTLIVNYSNQNQLEEFFRQMKVLRDDDGRERSMLCGLFRPDFKDDYITMMGKFFNSVRKKLSSSALKELLLHTDNSSENRTFIFSFALNGEEKVIETMLSYLDERDREKVQRKVNKYLDKIFNIPPKRKKTSEDLL